MYELAYEKLPIYEQIFICKMNIIVGDIDSLFISVTGKVDLLTQLYPSMIERGFLDTSNYPKDHKLFNNSMNAKLGCVKDEFKGGICKEVVLLAPKCYSFSQLDDPVPKQT